MISPLFNLVFVDVFVFSFLLQLVAVCEKTNLGKVNRKLWRSSPLVLVLVDRRGQIGGWRCESVLRWVVWEIPPPEDSRFEPWKFDEDEGVWMTMFIFQVTCKASGMLLVRPFKLTLHVWGERWCSQVRCCFAWSLKSDPLGVVLSTVGLVYWLVIGVDGQLVVFRGGLNLKARNLSREWLWKCWCVMFLWLIPFGSLGRQSSTFDLGCLFTYWKAWRPFEFKKMRDTRKSCNTLPRSPGWRLKKLLTVEFFGCIHLIKL